MLQARWVPVRLLAGSTITPLRRYLRAGAEARRRTRAAYKLFNKYLCRPLALAVLLRRRRRRRHRRWIQRCNKPVVYVCLMFFPASCVCVCVCRFASAAADNFSNFKRGHGRAFFFYLSYLPPPVHAHRMWRERKETETSVNCWLPNRTSTSLKPVGVSAADCALQLRNSSRDGFWQTLDSEPNACAENSATEAWISAHIRPAKYGNVWPGCGNDAMHRQPASERQPANASQQSGQIICGFHPRAALPSSSAAAAAANM